jgi:hypothetical protein
MQTRAAAAGRREREAGRLHITGTKKSVAMRPAGVCPRQLGETGMRIEIYPVVYWIGIAALIGWTAYSAYSAFALS